MPTISQIRGILLEEILLHLLRSTGYRTVEAKGTDPTLYDGPAGLEVFGRGGKHQIDAIADFKLYPPFSHPQRLLVEAKCFTSKPIGIEIPRNAIGVLKDICEYSVTAPPSTIPTSRYHYQYALFSVTPYTKNTQRYAFAQDIYLISLGNSRFFAPIIHAIHNISPSDFSLTPSGSIELTLSSMRRLMRETLKSGFVLPPDWSFPTSDRNSLRQKLTNLVDEVLRIAFGILAVFEGGFPVFLVPNDPQTLHTLADLVNVRIRWDDKSWYLDDTNNRRLFSFDLPQQLFDLFASRGRLRPEQALNLKEIHMSSFYAFLTINEEVRVIRFQLDTEWIEAIREARRRH